LKQPHRRFPRQLLKLAIGLGLLAMPFAVVLGAEDGPMPADKLRRHKAFARGVLFAGGAVAASASIALYLFDRRAKPRPTGLEE
jgi:hypothetical protein